MILFFKCPVKSITAWQNGFDEFAESVCADGKPGIPNLTTNEGAPPFEIELSSYFDDLEDGSAGLPKISTLSRGISEGTNGA